MVAGNCCAECSTSMRRERERAGEWHPAALRAVDEPALGSGSTLVHPSCPSQT